jgi:hypothetical protein
MRSTSFADAIKQAHIAEYRPNFLVLNPSDWFDIEIRKVGTSDDRYVVGNPRDMMGPNLWGLPVDCHQQHLQWDVPAWVLLWLAKSRIASRLRLRLPTRTAPTSRRTWLRCAQRSVWLSVCIGRKRSLLVLCNRDGGGQPPPVSVCIYKYFQDTLIGGQWTGVGVGNFQPDIAQHLIEIGVAEPYEVKVVEPTETKIVKKALSSASQPAPASPESKPKRRRGRPPKSSASTTPGDFAQEQTTSTPAMKDGGGTTGTE